jgi:hypothetical protein
MAASIHQNQSILSIAWLSLRRAGRVASIEFAHFPGKAILIMMSLWQGTVAWQRRAMMHCRGARFSRRADACCVKEGIRGNP